VLSAASVKSHRACADFIIEQFTDCSEPVANALVRVAHGLGTADLATGRITRLVKVAKAREDHYGLDLLEVLGPVSDDALAELRNRADAGNAAAFRALLVAGSDEHDGYLELGRSAARTVKQMVTDARGKDGTVSFSVYPTDKLHDLAVAALNTGDTRLWKVVTDALEAGVIEEGQLQRLLSRAPCDRLPAGDRVCTPTSRGGPSWSSALEAWDSTSPCAWPQLVTPPSD